MMGRKLGKLGEWPAQHLVLVAIWVAPSSSQLQP
jgi:hypothetical protein